MGELLKNHPDCQQLVEHSQKPQFVHISHVPCAVATAPLLKCLPSDQWKKKGGHVVST